MKSTEQWALLVNSWPVTLECAVPALLATPPAGLSHKGDATQERKNFVASCDSSVAKADQIGLLMLAYWDSLVLTSAYTQIST